MNESGERCLWLALVAAVPIGALISRTMGMTVLASALVGLITTFLITGAAIGWWSWRYVGWLHRRSRHWVLTFVAIGLPAHYFPVWLEQMQAQLNELEGKRRRMFLVDLALSAPKSWIATGWDRAQCLRARYYRGNEIRLAAHLTRALEPDGVSSTPFELLHAVGVSRLQNRRSAHKVLALELTQRLLSTQGEHFKAAREVAADLLETREQIYLLTRDVRRTQLRAWPSRELVPYFSRYEELETLRRQALQRSGQLRTALRAGLLEVFIGA